MQLVRKCIINSKMYLKYLKAEYVMFMASHIPRFYKAVND